MTAAGTVQSLAHYPIKGLSGQELDSVTLEPGYGFPFDRSFGFARAGSGFDPENPKPLPKHRFHILMRDAALAELKTRFDPDTQVLRVNHNGQHFSIDLSAEDGRTEAARFLTDLLSLGSLQQPSFVYAHPHRFTDVSVVSPEMMNAISLINLDSVKELERKIRQSIDPRRFRANVYFDGWAPFSELDRVGDEVTIGDARLRVCMRTTRCAATEVNPETAERDLRLPKLIRQHYGHLDMGVYAEVVGGGAIRIGDSLV